MRHVSAEGFEGRYSAGLIVHRDLVVPDDVILREGLSPAGDSHHELLAAVLGKGKVHRVVDRLAGSGLGLLGSRESVPGGKGSARVAVRCGVVERSFRAADGLHRIGDGSIPRFLILR